jgi:RNA polymerase sigma-70 factor (ECF subfamily)
MTDPGDAFLVLLAQAGDREALGQLLAAVQPRLRSYLRMVTGDGADADDVLQDTFVIAVRKLRFLRDPAVFRPWLYRIATREAHRRRQPRELALDAATEPASAEDFECAALAAEAGERLRAAVAGLPDRAREVVALHYFEDMALDEIAAVLDAPLGTIKSRLAYGLSRLRKDTGVK